MYRSLRFFLLLSVLLVTSCAPRYEPIPWRDAGERHTVLEKAAQGLIDALAVSLKDGEYRKPPRYGEKDEPLRVVLATFSEAHSGARTHLSLRLERVLRRLLGASDVFHVVDRETSVRWQEAFFTRGAQRFGGRNDAVETRRSSARALDADHPLEGLWPKVRAGPYGEDSAVYAASMLGAEAAIYGGYALGENRIRIWASIVQNAPAFSEDYRRGAEDIFGEPIRQKLSRPYLAYARGALPVRSIPRKWLTKRMPPRPRKKPVRPKSWGNPSFEAYVEEMDREGTRRRLYGGETLRPDALVLGRLRVHAPLYVYGFSIDRRGRVSQVLGSSARRGGATLLRPDANSYFTIRLRGESQTYRVYFVSRPKAFSAETAIKAAYTRLGLLRGGENPALTHKDVARGAPRRAWLAPAGQDRLILGDGWGQEVFWFHVMAERS